MNNNMVFSTYSEYGKSLSMAMNTQLTKITHMMPKLKTVQGG